MRHQSGARLLVEVGEHGGGKGHIGQALQQFALLAERHVMENFGALAAVQLGEQSHQIGVCLTAQQATGRLHRQGAMGCHFPRLGRWGSIHEIGSGACTAGSNKGRKMTAIDCSTLVPDRNPRL